MAGVVGYFQLRVDEQEFLSYLDRTGLIMAVPATWVQTRAEMAPERIKSLIEYQDPCQIFFGPGELQAEIEAKRFGDDLLFGMAHMKSCVVGYRRGATRDGVLTMSTLSVYWNYPSEDGTQLLTKDDEFVRWSKRILNWVRRRTGEKVECDGYPYRATKRVKLAVRNGTLRVALC